MYPMAKCLPTKVILLRSYTAISLFQSNVFFYIVVLLIASVCSFRIERCYLKLQSSVYIDIGKLERERVKLREGEIESPERLFTSHQC